MALPDIIEKLQSDATAEVANITAVAATEIESIKSKNEMVLKAQTEEAAGDRARRAEKVAERILAKARHQAAFIETAAIQAELEAVFSAAEKQLAGLPDDAYLSYLEKSFAELPKDDKATFVVAAEKKEATTDFLKKKGVDASAISETKGLKGGFVMNTESREYDSSFTGLLNFLRTEKSVAISQSVVNQ